MKSYTTLFVTCMCCVMLAVCLDTAPVVTDNRGPTLESLATNVALAHYEGARGVQLELGGHQY